MSDYETIILNAICNANDPNRAVKLFAAIVEKIANGETIESQQLVSPLVMTEA